MGSKSVLPAFMVVLLLTISMGAVAGPTTSDGDAKGDVPMAPKAFFPQTKYTFKPLFEGEDIEHEFVVENVGNAPLVIKNVRPG